MNKSDLAQKIFNCAYIRGDFLLRSGQRSNEYFDKYQFESNPDLLSAIAEKMAETVLSLPIYPGLQKIEVEYICKQISEFKA